MWHLPCKIGTPCLYPRIPLVINPSIRPPCSPWPNTPRHPKIRNSTNLPVSIHVAELLSLSVLFQMNKLKSYCCEYLSRNLHAKTVLHTAVDLAIRHNLIDLIRRCFGYLHSSGIGEDEGLRRRRSNDSAHRHRNVTPLCCSHNRWS